VLKQAFEDQRLTQEEFEARVGSALSARTQGELAALTRDLPSAPAAVATRRPRRTGLMAAVTPATVRRGGGERALADAAASCQADAAGVTLVTTNKATYLVTSYPEDKAASQAVGAALNTHASLAAGLTDATRRLAAIDPNHG
jgi:uncharacterized protein DUF1707